MFLSTLFYYLWITGHKFHCFSNSSEHLREQLGGSSYFIWLDTIVVWFNFFHIFYAFTFILQDTLTLYSYSFLTDLSSQFWKQKIYTKTKISARQQKGVLDFVMFCVMKAIVCTFIFLFSIFLQLLNCRNQSSLCSRQDIDQRCWVCLIYDLTSWSMITWFLFIRSFNSS